MQTLQHETVLLEPAVDALITDRAGFYIDGTFGRGGHSRLILSRLGEQGRLLAIDKDPQAIAVGQKLSAEDARFSIEQEVSPRCRCRWRMQGWQAG